MITKNKLTHLITQLFLLLEAVKRGQWSSTMLQAKAVLKEYQLTKEQRETLLSLIGADDWNIQESRQKNYNALCSAVVREARLRLLNNYPDRLPSKEDSYKEAVASLEWCKEDIVQAVASLIEHDRWELVTEAYHHNKKQNKQQEGVKK